MIGGEGDGYDWWMGGASDRSWSDKRVLDQERGGRVKSKAI